MLGIYAAWRRAKRPRTPRRAVCSIDTGDGAKGGTRATASGARGVRGAGVVATTAGGGANESARNSCLAYAESGREGSSVIGGGTGAGIPACERRRLLLGARVSGGGRRRALPRARGPAGGIVGWAFSVLLRPKAAAMSTSAA